MSHDILTLLQEKEPTFSKSQKRIAHYIIEAYDKAAFMTANRLGKTVGVSESTVVRFAVDLGFDGYPSMQKAMREMVLNRLTSVQRIEVANDRFGDQDVVSTVLQADMEKLRQTGEILDRDSFRSAVNAILKAKRVYILGVRSVAPLANFLGYYLDYMFNNVHVVSGFGTGEMFEKIVGVNAEDAVIAFSFPRYSASTTKGAQYCRSTGATVIGITDSTLSPLGQCSDHVLVAKSDMVSLVDSLVAPLSVVNALIVAIAAQREKELSRTFANLERIWDQYDVYEKQVEKMMEFDGIVIGGGPAGMFAAITAAKKGAKVLLLERNDRLGKKLLITGKGRCNVTNDCTAQEVLQNTPRNGRFLFSAMTAFPPEKTKEFFESNGCGLKTERGNRVFPVSDKAISILDCLQNQLRGAHVTVKTARVKSILIKDGRAVGVETQNEKISASWVILATGGASYPTTGSTGDGYTMAAALGHTIVPAQGSLVPLETAGSDCQDMQGLSLRNVAVKLLNAKGKVLYRDFGELLFTHFGISGPTVLSASCHLKGEGCRLLIDMKPALEENKLDDRIQRDLALYQNRSMENALTDLLPRSMIPVVLRKLDIDPQLQANSLTRQKRRALVELLKAFPVEITGKRPVAEAIITSGGVKVSEIDPKTMESKKVPGLYFAGEVIDCDAYTGGFNLQIAWATAFAAANAAVEN